MANPRMTLLDLLNKSEQGADPEFLRDGLKLLAQELMDAEVTQLAGAGLHERSENRLTYRNGYREREWDTRVGTIELDIPKLRRGSYFPSLLEPRRRHERALLSVVQEASSMASAPARWTLWPRPLGSRASPRTRSAGSARSWMPRSTPSAPAPWTMSAPT